MSGGSAYAGGRGTATPGVVTAAERDLLAAALPAYEIGEELGRGACGVVIAARHRQLGRDVAVKQLAPGLTIDSEVGARFLAEARVLAALDHPNVVLVHDFVEADGLCLLIMERLDGGTVKDRLMAGGLSTQAACAAVVAACSGLHYAHSKGVLHRDVKPQNLLLSAEGIVKVADFGIAKVLSGPTSVTTRTGMLLGTPAYMAPELVTGSAPSAAVDVYAAGVVLYELLCGELPYRSTDDLMGDLLRRTTDDPIPLLERSPGLPRSLAEITARALQCDPADRFATAEDLARAVAIAASAEWGSAWMVDARTRPAPERQEAAATDLTVQATVAPTAQRARSRPLERGRELARIAAALDCAQERRGKLVVIEGSPGIGKTRLVDEARALAKARGFGRVTATGYDHERALAWGVIRQLVERSVLRFPEDVRDRILEGPAGRVLEALDRAPSDAATDETDLAPTLHALWWVTADLSAERPLLITVDDAQWADRSSLRFLLYLGRRISDLAVTLIVTMRPPDADDSARAELVAAPSAERIVPGPLSQEAIAALMRSGGVVPSEAVVRALHEACGGNPFFAGQLLNELGVRECSLDDPRTAELIGQLGPAAIARTLLGRLRPEALQLARMLAVTGTRDGPAHAIRLSGLDLVAAGQAIDTLVALDVLEPSRELSFSHPVVREAVLAEMRPGQRGALHGIVARDLAERDMPADRVAAHVVLAPPGVLPDAANWLREAGRALLAAGDPVSAVTYLRRAAEEAPVDRGLRGELGEALLHAGRPAEARDLLRAAAPAAVAPLERARWLAAAASATLALEGPANAASELRDLLAQDGAVEDRAARLKLEGHLGGICAYDPAEFSRSGERLEAFKDLQGATPDERVLLALLVRRWWADVRPAAEVADLARRALGEGTWVLSAPAEYASFAGALLALIMTDDVESAWRSIAVAQSAVKEGAPRDFILVSGARLLAYWREGDVDATIAEGYAALEALELAGRDPAVAAVHAVAVRQLALSLLESGNVGEAARIVQEYEALAGKDGTSIPGHRVRQAAAALALALGDPGRARAEAEALGAAECRAGADNPSVSWRAPAALAASRLGDDGRARALAHEQLELANRWGAATDIGAALRLAAAVDPAGRLERLSAAVEVLERSPARLELGWALHDLGQAVRIELQDAAARDPLRRAADLARDCGAVVLRQRVVQALVALGDERCEEPIVPLALLTPSERRVAGLAAAGRSYRDIARELFVTPKAVEDHLARVYAKLGVGGRIELAALLAA